AGEVDVSNCLSLRELPPALRVTEWLDIGNAPLRALPPSRRGFQLRWLGVPIHGLAALHPETITAQQVLKQGNAEIRRAMLDRMGVERFMSDAQAEVLDEDADAGGQRRLLRVVIPDDEALVCLSVRDPSTGRHYLIRVPPAMQNCHQSAAWIASYDNPDDYHPVVET
ncbi:MAG TPA: hypothetical protein VKB76_01775, partial [Ktedonobacterales bacterium]|nr:hypothetical protein [Ktedonobacterales bacterium]